MPHSACSCSLPFNFLTGFQAMPGQQQPCHPVSILPITGQQPTAAPPGTQGIETMLPQDQPTAPTMPAAVASDFVYTNAARNTQVQPGMQPQPVPPQVSEHLLFGMTWFITH